MVTSIPSSSGPNSASGPMNLTSPADVDLAHRMFRANCGPASFAALVGALVLDVIRYFPHFPHSPHTSIPQMKNAINSYGAAYCSGNEWPHVGLCILQLQGPWIAKNRFFEAAKHRHWVASNQGHVYDVNARSWLPYNKWSKQIMPQIVAAHSGCDGWALARAFELSVLPQTGVIPRLSSEVAV